MKKNTISFSVIFPGLLVLSCLMASCTSTRYTVDEMESGNKNITVENILKIKKGFSTQKEIEDIFGKPDSTLTAPDTRFTTWTYIYTKTKQNSFEHTPFLIDQTNLEIVFNAEGVVKEYIQTVSNRLKGER